MAATSYAQITTVIHRLQQLRSLLNPARVLQLVGEAVRAIQVEPPGDPGALRELAEAYRGAGHRVSSIGQEVRSLSTGQLPRGWQGQAADSASASIAATAGMVCAAQPAFDGLAGALEAYAGTVQRLKQRHGELHQRLREAAHDATHIGVLGLQLPGPDPAALARLVSAVAGILTGCIGLYNESLAAADRLRGQLANGRGKARAQHAREGGLPALDSVVLAAAAVDGTGVPTLDDGVLTPDQLRRGAEARGRLPVADRAVLDQVMAQAGSVQERAYLMKTLAAGHSVTELAGFADQIRGRGSSWLEDHLSLVDPSERGGLYYRGQAVVQLDKTTCGSTSILMARSMADPMYAFQLTTGGRPDDSDSTSGSAFKERLGAEERRIHDATNRVWPQDWGTTPPGVAGELNRHAEATGTRYDWQLVDDTDRRNVEPVLRRAVEAVNAGHPVPVLLGTTAGQFLDGKGYHYVLLIGHEGENLRFYEPTDGEVVEVSESDFRAGRLGEFGNRHLQAVVLPE